MEKERKKERRNTQSPPQARTHFIFVPSPSSASGQPTHPSSLPDPQHHGLRQAHDPHSRHRRQIRHTPRIGNAPRRRSPRRRGLSRGERGREGLAAGERPRIGRRRRRRGRGRRRREDRERRGNAAAAGAGAGAGRLVSLPRAPPPPPHAPHPIRRSRRRLRIVQRPQLRIRHRGRCLLEPQRSLPPRRFHRAPVRVQDTIEERGGGGFPVPPPSDSGVVDAESAPPDPDRPRARCVDDRALPRRRPGYGGVRIGHGIGRHEPRAAAIDIAIGDAAHLRIQQDEGREGADGIHGARPRSFGGGASQGRLRERGGGWRRCR